MQPEYWRPVVGYEGFYEVSNQGRVKSLSRPGTHERILKGAKGNTPYWRVVLSREGRQQSTTVHRLVAEAFLGARPEGMVICHGENGTDDNSVGNLRYDTQANNNRDKYRDGTNPAGIKNPAAKLTEADVDKIRALCRTTTQRQVARLYGITQSAVSLIVTGRNWSHLQPQEH